MSPTNPSRFCTSIVGELKSKISRGIVSGFFSKCKEIIGLLLSKKEESRATEYSAVSNFF